MIQIMKRIENLLKGISNETSILSEVLQYAKTKNRKMIDVRKNVRYNMKNI